MAQMRSGSDISNFLFHFCPLPPPPEDLTSDFPARSNIWKGAMRCQVCLSRWQLPWGRMTAHGPLFQLETGSMLGHAMQNGENSLILQRMKCQGLPFKPNVASEAKWTFDMYETCDKISPAHFRKEPTDWKKSLDALRISHQVHFAVFISRQLALFHSNNAR